MKRDHVLQLLRQHLSDFTRLGVTSLALFGSTARDESHAESDVDILVEFEGPATFDRYVDLHFYLEELLGCKVDLLTRNALREQIRPFVEEELIPVAWLSTVS